MLIAYDKCFPFLTTHLDPVQYAGASQVFLTITDGVNGA